MYNMCIDLKKKIKSLRRRMFVYTRVTCNLTLKTLVGWLVVGIVDYSFIKLLIGPSRRMFYCY